MTAVAARRAFIYHPGGRRRSTLSVCPVAAVIRPAVVTDAPDIHALIEEHAAEGRLLHRPEAELAAHIGRFVVATVSGRVVGCADLAPLDRTVGEVRSLVVAASARSQGIGRRLLATVIDRAREAGFARLVAFTHSPAYFIRAGFSIVPHAWLPEKVARDCRTCEQFRHCGQHPVLLPLVGNRQQSVSTGYLHG